MAQLIYRCAKSGRVIMTGIEMERNAFLRLHTLRTIPCKFCGQAHIWELVERVPDDCAVMSLLSETFFGRSVESAELATHATDPALRQAYERMADEWHKLAIEYEIKADALR